MAERGQGPARSPASSEQHGAPAVAPLGAYPALTAGLAQVRATTLTMPSSERLAAFVQALAQAEVALARWQEAGHPDDPAGAEPVLPFVEGTERAERRHEKED